jgi:hypothetical protein
MMMSSASYAPSADMIGPGNEAVDSDHGHLEQRRHVVCHDVQWMRSDRRYADEPGFPHLAHIDIKKLG